jgi:manganese efflux pump family protein
MKIERVIFFILHPSSLILMWILFLQIFALSIALAADAFTVAATVGLTHREPRQLFRMSFHFGLFQSLFSLAGAVAGSVFLGWVESYDHWIVCGVLAGLGLRMIYAAYHESSHNVEKLDLTKGLQMVGLSVAVSIDALGAGIGLPATGAPLFRSVFLIGIVTAGATLIAMLLAHHIKGWIGKYAEVGAGLVLIGLGVWAPLTHLGIIITK